MIRLAAQIRSRNGHVRPYECKDRGLPNISPFISGNKELPSLIRWFGSEEDGGNKGGNRNIGPGPSLEPLKGFFLSFSKSYVACSIT